ncbi:PEGA domain-containing protein [Sorangium sp. So ce131]|uniref:PEGA domain-containing protein n=1 Tax=Sorangium sp. So ce131 TaxID=3133282 RepID=UPI003F603290
MSRRRRSVPLALSAALALSSLAASAEPGASGRVRAPAPAAPTTSAADAGARDAIRRGDEARRAARWGEAALAYRAALEERRGPPLSPATRAEVAGELGLCELALGAHRDAAEHLRFSLDHRSALPVEQQRRFEAGQAQAEREVGALFLAVSPRDAEVLLDGRSLGAPRPVHVVFVEPGPHTVRARLAGYADAVAGIEAVRGASSSVTLALAASTPVPAPSARVNALQLHPGPAQPADPGDGADVLRRIALGTAAAGAVLGAGFWVAAEVLDGVVDERAAEVRERGGRGACNGAGFSGACRHQEALIARRDGVGAAAVAVLVASGALGALSVSSYWWAPAAPPRATAGFTPMTAGATGLSPGVTLQAVW